MKTIILCLAFLSISLYNYGQNAVFLHHSTGGNVFNDGDVAAYIDTYNTENETDIQITERAYPDSPYPWNNYPYDYWNLWINNECDNASSGIECLESIAAEYNIIIWKHCYPGAGLSDDDGEGNITSSSKSIPNYKLQYRALRNKMDAFPNKQFIVWTLAPLHRLATDAEQAQRAGEFVNWVKNDWLNEDSKDHPNIHIFDFFGIVAEQAASPEHGFQYCLKYDFERSHDGSDSHPNLEANETAGPLFAQFIIDVALGNPVHSKNAQIPENISVYPNPNRGALYFKGPLKLPQQIEIFNMLGERVKSFELNEMYMDIHELKKGIYFLKMDKSIFRIVRE